MLKVMAVCVNGMGSSLILRMTVEKAFKELGIAATVDHCDLGGFGGKNVDVVVTTPSLSSSIPAKDGLTVILIKNFVDVEGLKENIKKALNKG